MADGCSGHSEIFLDKLNIKAGCSNSPPLTGAFTVDSAVEVGGGSGGDRRHRHFLERILFGHCWISTRKRSTFVAF